MTTCETCNGKGEAVFSCCTGDIVDSDIMMCPVCYEHLGEEPCYDCDGKGEIEEDHPLCGACGGDAAICDGC